MITKISLIKNISQFDSVDEGQQLTLSRLALAYAENGRGKTTLAAIFRSLSSGDPTPILERHRVTTPDQPHVLIDHSNGTYKFENGKWEATATAVVVYDDAFVDENIHSGLSVDSEHRHNLHELIIGSQGVILNQQLKTEVEKIEAHNKVLRAKATPLTVDIRGTLTIEEFCQLPTHDNVDDAIKDTENSLAAAIQQEHIGQKPLLQEIRMPSLTMDSIKALLEKSLPDLEQEAATEVQSHLQSLGHGAEGWVAEGIKRINPVDQACPFCKQSLSNLEIIKYYRAYFSDAYKKLKSEIDESSALLNRLHGGEARAAFERAVRVLGESQKFWSNFEELPVISFDSVEISRRWRTAFESLVAIMDAKRSNPLEKISLSPEAGLVIRSFEESLNQISEQNKLIAEANAKIEVVKERASSGNMRALEADLAKLKATKIRYREDIQKICDEYQAESTAKSGTEQRRDKIREALNQHQTSIFPAFNTAINDYLRKFNAGFRLSNIAPENTRGGTACTYNVVIYDQSIPIGGSQPRAGQRGFKNTLSSGDRNTLALAFFFAMVDQNPNSKDAIVVIDDPMTSLDDHRTLTTAQEIRALSLRAKQVIVLSHSKPFLCRIWQHAVRTHRTSIQVVRDGTGSTLKAWDVREDSITEYDRKHQLLRDYSANGNNSREVAEALRPVMEGYLRVGCPKYFPPGTLLGPFRGTCEQKVGTTDEILSRNDIDELRNLTEYANKFHHDSNPAWETEAINDGELLGFTERTLNFIKRK